MLWRRTVSVLMAGMLVMGLLTVSAEAKGTDPYAKTKDAYTDILTTSYDPGNYITFSVDRDTLTFEGILTRDGLDQIMFQLQDENGALLGSKVTFDISSGVSFSSQVTLSDIPELPERVFAEIYTSTTSDKSDDLWNNHGKSVLLVKTDGMYRIAVSPIFLQNGEYFSEWINPGTVFDAEVSDNIRALCARICSGARSDYEKVGAIYKWVVENIHYDYDYVSGVKNRTAVSVSEVYTNRYALSAGFCNILEALLEAAGIPAVITRGHTTNMSELLADKEYQYTNLAVEAFADGRWIVMLPYRETAKKYENGEYLTWIGRAYRGFDISHEFLANIFEITSRERAADTDVPSDWARDEVKASINAGVVPPELQCGYSNSVTREEFCKLIMNMLAVRLGTADMVELLSAFSLEYSQIFADTDCAQVNAAYLLGIVSGRVGDTFDPNGELTRQEAAVMLASAARLLGIYPSASTRQFSDIESAADWARESINTVTGIISANGTAVMGGVDGEWFSPLSTYTKEQAIVTVHRLYTCN